MGQEAEGRVVTPQSLSPLPPGVFTVPNLPQPLSLGPALPQTPPLPEFLNVQSFPQLLVLIQSSPDEFDPALKVKLLELIAAVLVILDDVGGDVAEGDDAIIQVWAVQIRHVVNAGCKMLYPRLMQVREENTCIYRVRSIDGKVA